jgi:hypothetical protein
MFHADDGGPQAADSGTACPPRHEVQRQSACRSPKKALWQGCYEGKARYISAPGSPDGSSPRDIVPNRFPTDRWPSGLRRTPGTRVYVKAYRGFESLSVRHIHPIAFVSWQTSGCFSVRPSLSPIPIAACLPRSQGQRVRGAASGVRIRAVIDVSWALPFDSDKPPCA